MHVYQAVDRILSEWYRNVQVVAVKVAKNYDQEFILRKLRKCKLIENKCFRIGQVNFHNQKLVLIVRATEEEDEDVDILDDEKECGDSFEEIMEQLPQLTNSTGSNSV